SPICLRPPRPTLFPYTTLFRSSRAAIFRGRTGRNLATRTSLNGCLNFKVAIKNGSASWFVRENAFQASSLGGSTPICSIQKPTRSEEHTSELQSRVDLVCRLLL